MLKGAGRGASSEAGAERTTSVGSTLARSNSHLTPVSQPPPTSDSVGSWRASRPRCQASRVWLWADGEPVRILATLGRTVLLLVAALASTGALAINMKPYDGPPPPKPPVELGPRSVAWAERTT